ncbi:MAG TPA: PHB depolymerase family esterase [Solirubrobacteraceae bacterium]|jgi:polyhydroxybutyrate depolymerase|nr:PHB depolymerase family esterase [Solirubrobacteraceae bacterium]
MNRGRRVWGGLGLVAAIILGLSTGSAVAVAATPTPCTSGTLAGDQSITMTVGGVQRSARLHVPSSKAGTGLPLIVAYHGYGGNGAEFERDTGLSTLADKEGFAVVYPSSEGDEWAISGGERDVVFTSAVLDRVESMACIDPARVYATGVSIGAGMAARAGCELSARIAGLVLVSGGYRSLPACNPDRPLSILEIHGTADTTVPYKGRGASEAGAVLPYVVAWAARDRCAVSPTHTNAGRHTLLYRWSGCASGVVVEHLRIYGGKHGLPNAVGEEISSGDTSSIDGTYEIWHFLASRTLAQPFAPIAPVTPGPAPA